MENINVNGYQFENEQAYVAMELTKAWLAYNYVNEDRLVQAFNTIYNGIGKAGKEDAKF